MVFSYQQFYDKTISDELKIRHRDKIETLQATGFSFFGLHREMIWPFSVIFFFPIYLMMVKLEYLRIETPLRITTYHLLYFSKTQATIAYIYGLGCKFYTGFADGSWLVTNTGQNIRDRQVETIQRDSGMATAEQVWQRHQARILELTSDGKELAGHLTFDDWADLESRFDRSNLASMIGTGLAWNVFILLAIYWLVSNGLALLKTILGMI